MEANAANAARGRQGKRAGLAIRANSLRAGMDLKDAGTNGHYILLCCEAMQQQARRTNQDIMNAYYRSGIGQTVHLQFGPAPVHGGYRNDPSPSVCCLVWLVTLWTLWVITTLWHLNK